MQLLSPYFKLDIGDLCDDDIDGDGVLNEKDNCPLVANPDQEAVGKSKKGKACLRDFDGDGVDDDDDVCPENPEIKYTKFSKLRTMDLCEMHNKKKRIVTSCNKEKPVWENRDNGREVYQGKNSRVRNLWLIKRMIRE